MNRRHPESHGGRDRDQLRNDAAREDRVARSPSPREEETSRWTSEGGSQTAYRRDDMRNDNPSPSQGSGQYAAQTPYGGGQYVGQQHFGAASGYGGQYGAQQGYGGTPFGASPQSGGPVAQSPGYASGGYYRTPLGSSLHTPAYAASDVRGSYGAQPGYASPYGSPQGEQYGGGVPAFGSSAQDYPQHYGQSTHMYHQQYGAPAFAQYGGGYLQPQRNPDGRSERGGYQQPAPNPGYGYQYGAGPGYAAGSQYGASGGYGQGNEQQAAHRGRGPKNYVRSNDRLREDICERLSDDPYIDASEIEVTVADNGRVVIEGSVAERWMKHRVEDMVDASAGVSQIENRLQVARASQSPPATRAPGAAASSSTPATPGSEAGKRH